jgi:Ca-activated chloride channel family protein
MKPFLITINKSLKRSETRYVILATAYLAIVVSFAVLVGCGPAAPMPPGVTAGGAQDIAHARQIIEDGDIPDPEAITVEGFMSEHSIPTSAPEDAGLLYATAAAAWNKDFDAFTPLVTIQLGFGTTIDMEQFEREPLNVCVVLDRSGSMDERIDERTGATKWDAVLISVDRLLSKLNGDDRVSIVTFDSGAHLEIEGAAGDDIAAIKGSFDDVTPEGATDLIRGMRAGYRAVARQSADERMDRIIVFTDALPVGWLTVHSSEDFIDIMEEYAERDIGTTIFGVGLHFGTELAYDISQVRGGNYFFLSDYDRIVGVFDEDFDFLVTPVAYDVAMSVSVPFEYDVEDLYGIPVSEEALPHTVEIVVPTLFLSSREGGGAIMLRIRPGSMADLTQAHTVADIDLTYTTPDGETFEDSLLARLPADLDPEAVTSYFESDAARRAVLLLNTALVLRNACQDMAGDPSYYWRYYTSEDRQRAIDRLTEFLPYFDALADGLEDRLSTTSRGLSDERALLEQLLENIEKLD